MIACGLAAIGKAWPETGDTLNRAGFRQTFADNFDHPISLYDRASRTGRWKTNYDFGAQDNDPSSRTLNGEMEVYSDPSYNNVNPFVLTDGGLAIVAAVNRNPHERTSAGRPYTSGLITTATSFLQKYGYFEMAAVLPQGAGMWPAFWLAAPLDPRISTPQHPGEIDVMEMLGRDPTRIYCSAHWPDPDNPSGQGYKTMGVDIGRTDTLHSYGVLWTHTKLVWYVDGVEVRHMANPGLDRPMAILANLAVGGSWGGPPNAATRFPARMVIKYIRAYAIS
jgi:beta-glucanase (GH16 family)